MSTTFNDSAAWLNGQGNLTLGNSRNDAAADATHKYAKGDLWCIVDVSAIRSTTDPALTNVSVGVYKKTLVASTTHTIKIPFPTDMLRTYSGDLATSSPHGIKPVSLTLFYRVNTNDLTSISLKAYTVPHAAGTAIYTATELTSTVAGNTVTAAANIYAAKASITTPAFVNTSGLEIVGESVIVTPASCTCDLLGAMWLFSAALY